MLDDEVGEAVLFALGQVAVGSADVGEACVATDAGEGMGEEEGVLGAVLVEPGGARRGEPSSLPAAVEKPLTTSRYARARFFGKER